MSSMNGLRIYRKLMNPQPAAVANIFYSRRGNGPIYCWLYEEKLNGWRFSRINSADIATNEWSLASWKSVPDELQSQLAQHYVE